MKSQRNGSSATKRSYPRDLLEAIGYCLPQRGLPLMSDDSRVRWTPRLLVVTAMCSAWAVASTCQEAFAIARKSVVEMYPTRRRPGKSYQGFTKALALKSAVLLGLVVESLRHRTREVAGARWRQDGWVVMSVDGSSVRCPRTVANENAFGYSGKERSAPTQTLTALFHVGSGQPWSWRRGNARANETAHLRSMLDDLPEKTLLLADAHYTSYDLLRALGQRGHRFIIRIGKNVRLLRGLGYAVRERAGTVYLWPKGKQRKTPPLVLRLVTVGTRRNPVYLVTNVLETSTLSNRAVGNLYRQRWGVEVLYRSLKQTLGRATLRSTAPVAAQLELDWAMAGLWMLGVMAQRTMRPRHRPKWSVADARRAVRTAMGNLPRRRPAGGLAAVLRKARTDEYDRKSSKTSRDYPRKKQKKPPGAPKIRMAEPKEILCAQAYKPKRRAG